MEMERRTMRCRSEMMRLYAVTDRTWTKEQTLLQQVEAAIRGGVTCVQLREKELEEARFLQEAVEMQKLCKRYQIPLIINDRVDIAKKCKASGVHLGQKDMEAGKAREVLGSEMILGVSARTVEQAIAAERAGADYLGVGAVFATSTKSDAKEISHGTLKAICESVRIPVVAIGGIGKQNLKQLSGTGIAGVALVSAIFGAEDIERECSGLLKTVRACVGESEDENSIDDCRE